METGKKNDTVWSIWPSLDLNWTRGTETKNFGGLTSKLLIRLDESILEWRLSMTELKMSMEAEIF
jgi:hypothetical protein